MLMTFNTRIILSERDTRSKVICLVYFKRTVCRQHRLRPPQHPLHRRHTGRQANPTSLFLSIAITFRASSGRCGRAEPTFRKMWTSAWTAADLVQWLGTKPRANLTWSCPRSDTPDSPHHVDEAPATFRPGCGDVKCTDVVSAMVSTSMLSTPLDDLDLIPCCCLDPRYRVQHCHNKHYRRSRRLSLSMSSRAS
jgi:hypothetical protein